METIRMTRSVCPVCLRKLEAALRREADGSVTLNKTCQEHGSFSVPVWRGKLDFDRWIGSARPLGELGQHCPDCEGICAEHEIGSCCVLLEVTRRCNLRCRFCFADGAAPEPTLAELKAAVDEILRHGRPLIQLSGGEPTLRDDLPELVRHAKTAGASTVQINTNGLRLAADAGYASALQEAGLDIVFLQFDGTDDAVYETLRGRPLLAEKERAIEHCAAAGLGVTLVPTVVRGVNDDQIGEIIRYGAFLSPVVRGVHFQPVSYFGKYTRRPEDDDRYTLDELIHALSAQTGFAPGSFAPSHCDHPACGLHGSFLTDEFGELTPLTHWDASKLPRCTSAAENRAYIGSRWSAPETPAVTDAEPGSLDDFLNRAGRYGFTVTAMAFQDALNLDVERLRRCSLHVYENGRLIPFCAKYLTRMD